MIIVAGTFRVPEDRIEDLMPVARATLAATRKETGCVPIPTGSMSRTAD